MPAPSPSSATSSSKFFFLSDSDVDMGIARNNAAQTAGEPRVKHEGRANQFDDMPWIWPN